MMFDQKDTSHTKPAVFVTCCGWNVTDHPVMAWMKDYAHAFDKGDLKQTGPGKWLTQDYIFVKPTGEKVSGVGKAWDSLMEIYAPMSQHYHEPTYGIIWETSDGGYELFGVANMYYNLHSPPKAGSYSKRKDESEGGEWEACTPGAFHFRYKKEKDGHGGLKMCQQILYVDTFPLVGEMVRRGMVKPEQVGL